MDAHSIKRIRDSFNLLSAQADRLMNEFYDRLFAAYPAVRPMFPKDMAAQKKHLLSAVALVVKNADRLGVIEKPLMEMGARHVGYGAKPEHYPIVRDVLLDSMKALAGAAWTDQLRSDWAAAINAVAVVMLRGAESVKKAA